MYSVESYLKMQVLSSCSSCSASQSYRFAGFDFVSWFYQILGVMAIDSFQTVVVPDDNDISICRIWFRHSYDTVKSSNNGVIGFCLFGLKRMFCGMIQRKIVSRFAEFEMYMAAGRRRKQVI